MDKRGFIRKTGRINDQSQNFHGRVLDCPFWKLEKRRKEIDNLKLVLEKETNCIKRYHRERQLRLEIVNLKSKIIANSFILFEKYFQVFERSWKSTIERSSILLNENFAKTKEIQKLIKERAFLNDVVNELRQRATQVQLAKNYLTDVQQSANAEYSTIDDIIKRFEFLYNIRQVTSDRISASEQQRQDNLQVLEESVAENVNETLTLEQKVIDLEGQLEERRIELNSRHEILLELKDKFVQNSTKPSLIQAAITNLYYQTAQKLGTSVEDKPIDEQVNLIDVAFKRLAKMQKDAREMECPNSNWSTVNSTSRKSILKVTDL